MHFSNSCSRTRTMRRCHTPLIEICDNTSQIKLDLGSCGACAARPAALLLQKGGCTEYEVVCEQQTLECCGVIDNRPITYQTKQSRPIPKPSVLYPLHEIDTQGMSVFVLDGKMRILGYGRLHAVVLLLNDTSKKQSLSIADYTETNLVFDIDYTPPKLGLTSISTRIFSPTTGDC